MIRQHGQSLVEFASGSAALLLLLLGMITLSGYQEVQRRGSLAARQVAFESAWQTGGVAQVESSQRMHRLHFGDAGLQDAVGRENYVAEDSVRVTRQRNAAPGLAGNAASLLLTPLEAGRALTGGVIDLEPGGYASGELVARLVPQEWTPEPFRGLDISLRQPYAILSDPWNSGSAQHVRERTSSLVPTQRMASIATAWQLLAVPLSILEPSIGSLCLGLIEPDTVPEDRLGPRVRGLNSGRLCQ